VAQARGRDVLVHREPLEPAAGPRCREGLDEEGKEEGGERREEKRRVTESNCSKSTQHAFSMFIR